MPTDIFQVQGSPNTYGPVVLTSYKSYLAKPYNDIPEPDVTGLNNTYQNRFLVVNGEEYSMDRILPQEYFASATTATTGLIGQLYTMNFPSSGSPAAVFTSQTSSNYGRRPLNVRLEWTTDSTGLGEVVWQAQIRPYTVNTELTGTNYQTLVSGTYSAPASGQTATSDIRMTYESMDYLSKSDLYGIKIIRRADSSSDTHNSAARLLAIELIESSTVN